MLKISIIRKYYKIAYLGLPPCHPGDIELTFQKYDLMKYTINSTCQFDHERKNEHFNHFHTEMLLRNLKLPPHFVWFLVICQMQGVPQYKDPLLPV